MSRSNLVYAGVALLAGLLLGFAITALAFRHHWLRMPPHGVIDRMDRVLKLTPAQHAQIEAIVAQARQKAAQMREDFFRQRHEMIRQAHEHVRSLLTADQQRDFDRYFPLPRARPEHLRGRFGGGYPGNPP